MAKRGRPPIPKADRLTEGLFVSLSRDMLQRVETHAFDNMEGATTAAAIRDLLDAALRREGL